MKFAKRTQRIQNLIFHVDFLQKAISEQRKEIQQRKATEERQKAIIKYLKAELKELKEQKEKNERKKAFGGIPPTGGSQRGGRAVAVPSGGAGGVGGGAGRGIGGGAEDEGNDEQQVYSNGCTTAPVADVGMKWLKVELRSIKNGRYEWLLVRYDERLVTSQCYHLEIRFCVANGSSVESFVQALFRKVGR